MKRNYLIGIIGLVATFTLSGCSLFYPAPAHTAAPTPTKTPTAAPTPTPTIDPTLNKVKINIIDSSAFMANGYVEVVAEAENVLEDGGKCTLTLTQGSEVQKVTVIAVQNVTTTVCSSMQVPLSNFKAADINYTVTYVSPKSAGVSEPGIIQIQ
jgi:hypothetical protein